MRLFLIKPQLVLDIKTNKKVPTIQWMKENKSYPVLDIYKYSKTDKETGKSKLVTKFLSANPETGEMAWIDAGVVDYAGE